jgi:hypothetical protein
MQMIRTGLAAACGAMVGSINKMDVFTSCMFALTVLTHVYSRPTSTTSVVGMTSPLKLCHVNLVTMETLLETDVISNDTGSGSHFM